MLKVTRCEFVHNLPCEQVSGRLTELEAENAKLRERLKVCEGAYDVLTASIREKRQRINDLEDQLARHGLPIGGQAENAKLRELVLYAHECAIHSDHATCDDCRRMNGYCILERRMRELGVDG